MFNHTLNERGSQGRKPSLLFKFTLDETETSEKFKDVQLFY